MHKQFREFLIRRPEASCLYYGRLCRWLQSP